MGTLTPMSDSPPTTGISIVWIALGIVLLTSLVAIFVTRGMFSGPLRQLEKETVPVAQQYIQSVMSANSPEPELGAELRRRIGNYEQSRPVDLAIASGQSTGIAIRLRIKGSRDETDAIVLLDLKDGDYRVTQTELIP